MLVSRAGNHKKSENELQNACLNSKQGRLIRLLFQKQADLGLHWLSLFGSQLVFEILEHLQCAYS